MSSCQGLTENGSPISCLKKICAGRRIGRPHWDVGWRHLARMDSDFVRRFVRNRAWGTENKPNNTNSEIDGIKRRGRVCGGALPGGAFQLKFHIDNEFGQDGLMQTEGRLGMLGRWFGRRQGVARTVAGVRGGQAFRFSWENRKNRFSPAPSCGGRRCQRSKRDVAMT